MDEALNKTNEQEVKESCTEKEVAEKDSNIEKTEQKSEKQELELDNFIIEEAILDKKKTLLDLVEIAIRNKVENEHNGYCLSYIQTEQLLNDYCTIEDLKLPNGKAILNSMFKKIKASLEQPGYTEYVDGIKRLGEIYKRIEKMNFNS